MFIDACGICQHRQRRIRQALTNYHFRRYECRRIQRSRRWPQLVRQARSAATRRRIIDSAVDLINEIGYPASGLTEIIGRAELTKGAFYYHFDSKEALATAIIGEGAATVLDAFRDAGRPTSLAMANIVRGLFTVTEIVSTDRIAQAACRLLRTFGGFNPSAKQTYATLLAEMTQQVATSVTEGEVRSDIDPEVASTTIVGAMLGAALLSSAVSDGADLRARLDSTLQILLPVIVCEDSLGHYRDLLAHAAIGESNG
jgi:AcrR family transcriptional regulator